MPRGGEAVRIRPLRASDVEACARLVAADPLWQRYGLTFARARATIRGALRRGSDGGARSAGQFAVARVDGRVAGFVWFRPEGTFHHSGYIRWIGVAPTAQGQGVGRRLMAYAEAQIFRSGPNVFLLVSDFNRRAQAFYRRQGYTRVGAIPDYVVPGITEYVFRKTRGPIARAVETHRRQVREHARA
ncbi:MAG: N-acetyltransferase [Armatimonadota bacterium]|nr:N-acetyltransferase [Armatimonadota bacterium]